MPRPAGRPLDPLDPHDARELYVRASLAVGRVGERVERWVRRQWDQRRQREGGISLPPALRTVLVLAAMLSAMAGTAILTGHSEELIATIGERAFGVDPLPEDIAPPQERSTVTDVQGHVLGTITGPENRRVVTLDEVPEVLEQAVVATEDARFWEHDGIDTRGILRAAWANLRSAQIEQGGSTITQQYVKNALLTSERSMKRKVTEATWAVRLEQRLSKREILERYLNVVYLGDGTYGVAAAAEYWFGQPVDEIDLARSVVLAAMIRAPEALDPARNPEDVAEVRDRVLQQMQGQGLVTPEEAEAARVPVESLLQITPLPEPNQPMFVRYVTQQLLDDPRLGETRAERANVLFHGGLRITTTLAPEMQAAANAAIAERVTDPAVEPMAGIVSVVPGNGAIRAMALGPKGWGPCDEAAQEPCTTTTVNPLVRGMGSPGRQMGSAFKPLVVAAAIEQGLEPDWHTISRSGDPIEHPACPDYAPSNYSGKDGGLLDMTSALLASDNVFHVKLALAAGLENVVATAQELGVGGLQPYCSTALGSFEGHPLDLASAYATFAAGGVHCTPYAVATVHDRNGEPFLENEPDCERVLRPETAEVVSTLLQANARSGTGTRAQIDRPIAVKTGTTNDFRDAWLVGYTPRLATAAWIGFEQPQPMLDMLGFARVAGGTVPAQLWSAFMGTALAPYDPLELPSLSLPRYDRCAKNVDADDFDEGEQRCRDEKKQEKKDEDKGRKRKGRRD